MTIGINPTIRNNMLDEIAAAADAGVGAAILLILDGTRPATGAAITTEVTLATLTMGDPAFAAAAAGVLTANAITGDTSADATGTASWFRITDSAGVHVYDGDVGVAASDLNLTTTSITATEPVDVTSLTITAGNA